MRHTKDNNQADYSLESSMLFRLMEQYVNYRNKLREKHEELRSIHNNRPCVDFFQDGPNKEAFLIVLSYYKEKLFNCLREISEIEQSLEDTKKLISEFAPNNGKLCTINFKGEDFIIGFYPLKPDKKLFALVKKSNNEINQKPTYLPTYLLICLIILKLYLAIKLPQKY